MKLEVYRFPVDDHIKEIAFRKLNCLASCFIQTKDFLRAEEIYHRSFQLDPHQAYVKEILGEIEKWKTFEIQRRITP